MKLLLALVLLVGCKDDTKPPPAPETRSDPRAEALARAQAEVDRIETEMTALEAQMTAELETTKNLTTDTEREAARVRTAALEAKVTELVRQLDAAKAMIGSSARPLGNEIEQLQRQKEAIDREMLGLVERIEKASAAGDRTEAEAKLEKLRAEAAEIAKKISAKKP